MVRRDAQHTALASQQEDKQTSATTSRPGSERVLAGKDWPYRDLRWSDATGQNRNPGPVESGTAVDDYFFGLRPPSSRHACIDA